MKLGIEISQLVEELVQNTVQWQKNLSWHQLHEPLALMI